MLTEIVKREIAGRKLVLDERALAHLAEHRAGTKGGKVTHFGCLRAGVIRADISQQGSG